jgi:hypothetical protein
MLIPLLVVLFAIADMFRLLGLDAPIPDVRSLDTGRLGGLLMWDPVDRRPLLLRKSIYAGVGNDSRRSDKKLTSI